MINNNDIVNELETAAEQNSWFSALFSSIKNELKAGEIRQANKLAEIGQYLADDNQALIQERIEQIK